MHIVKPVRRMTSTGPASYWILFTYGSVFLIPLFKFIVQYAFAYQK